MNNILEVTDGSVLIHALKLTSKDTCEGFVVKTNKKVFVTFYKTNSDIKIIGVEVYISNEWVSLSELAYDRKELEKDINILLESQNEWYNNDIGFYN